MDVERGRNVIWWRADWCWSAVGKDIKLGDSHLELEFLKDRGWSRAEQCQKFVRIEQE